MSQSTNQQTNHVPSDNASEVGRLQLMIRTALSGLRTSMPVKVVSVTNSGGVSPIGYVDVQPLVGAMDGAGVVWPHGVIHNVPYMRIQGGANAIILDPQVGDIGIASVCDRDISAVKASKGAAPPGSIRKHDFSDMVYLMTIIAEAPTQYIRFHSGGIDIAAPGQTIAITSAALTHNGTNISNTHVHGGVTPGGGNTAGPQ
jgi:hypothetical protein